MVFNTTLNNISVISWRSVLLMVGEKSPKTKTKTNKNTDLPQVTDKLYHIMQLTD